MGKLSVRDILFIGLGVIVGLAILIGVICYFRWRDPKPKEPRDLEGGTPPPSVGDRELKTLGSPSPPPSVGDRELKTLGSPSPRPYQREHRRVLSAPACFNDDFNIGAGHGANAQDDHGEIQLAVAPGNNGHVPLPIAPGDNGGVPLLAGDNGHLQLPIAPGDHGHVHLLGDNAEEAVLNEHVPLPGNDAEAAPNGGMPVLNGVLLLPNGEVTLPNGGVPLPDGDNAEEAVLNEHVPLPGNDAEAALANGGMPLLNGVVLLPNGEVALVDGEVALPDGEIALVNGPGDDFDLPLDAENFLDGDEDDALLNVSPDEED